MDSRWRWPPESWLPRSPRWVSKPWGSASMSVSTFAWAADRLRASSSMPSRKNRMFSATVPVKRRASWATNATWLLHHERSTSRRSTPPTRTEPAVGSRRPSNSCARVDLPAPEGPMTPTTSPPVSWNVASQQRRTFGDVGELHVARFERRHGGRNGCPAVGRERPIPFHRCPDALEERGVGRHLTSGRRELLSVAQGAQHQEHDRPDHCKAVGPDHRQDGHASQHGRVGERHVYRSQRSGERLDLPLRLGRLLCQLVDPLGEATPALRTSASRDPRSRTRRLRWRTRDLRGRTAPSACGSGDVVV